jgi:hypothetical protein
VLIDVVNIKKMVLQSISCIESKLCRHGLMLNPDRLILKGSPDAAVKLLHCDHEVMGSSSGKSLLQKCRERMCT